MITTQTIELNDSERLTLQKALGIIEEIATIASTSISNVLDYLYDVAESKGDYEYNVKAIHSIDEIKGGE